MRYLTETEKKWSDSRLEKKVFIFDSAEAHKKFFKNKIIEYLNSDQSKTYSQWMWEAIWEYNDKGKYSMYLYFNERIQKLYIDKYFYEWMVRMIDKIDEQLDKVKELENVSKKNI